MYGASSNENLSVLRVGIWKQGKRERERARLRTRSEWTFTLHLPSLRLRASERARSAKIRHLIL